jgi:hypothetical protein
MRKVARVPAVLIAAAICGATSRTAAQPPSLEELLDRATAYVNDFFERFSNVVAEEHYVQEAGLPTSKRVLRSDFLLVTFPGLQGRMAFRDVFEVDGRPVRDASQQDRLMKLFANPSRDVLRRAREIAEASAPYSLADVATDPLVALGFLQASFRPRFRFVRGGLERDLGSSVRTVRFQEWQRPTVFRGGANNNRPARGLIWIEEPTGRVVKTELLLGGSEMVTTYQWDDELKMNVPVELRDSYRPAPPRDYFRGVATYGRFRRFRVSTAETIR